MAAFAVGVGALGLFAAWPEHRETPPAAEVAYQRHPMVTPMAGTRLPRYARATPELEQLYRFALERSDLLSYIPCTCGCVASGHHSNWNCYVRAVNADGTVVFDDMAPT